MGWLTTIAAEIRQPIEMAALVFVRGGGRASRPEDWAGLNQHEIAALAAAQRDYEVRAVARLAAALRGRPEDTLAEVDGGEARERRDLAEFADALAAGANAAMESIGRGEGDAAPRDDGWRTLTDALGGLT